MKKISHHLLLCLVLLGTVLLGYALYEPRTLKIKHYTLQNQELSGIKIVFAADFHLAPYDTKRLQNIISAINQEQPDIIILGGDYVKGHKKSSSMLIQKIAAAFAQLRAPYGIYAVLGNHDNWYGKKEVRAAFQKHHIQILDNDTRRIKIKNNTLTLVGISDMNTDNPDFIKAFKNAVAPAILITHSPDMFPQSPKTALTLAAHTHGGQINLPLIGAPVVPSRYGQRYKHGLIKENDKIMLVTKGLGTSILPLRFRCPPEFVVITFN